MISVHIVMTFLSQFLHSSLSSVHSDSIMKLKESSSVYNLAHSYWLSYRSAKMWEELPSALDELFAT